MTLWQRIKLFFLPPEGIQPECFHEKWCGVTSAWLNAVEVRFAHQERRAAAMKLLEEKSAVLKGGTSQWAPQGAEVVQCLDGPQVAILDIDPEKNAKWRECPHDHRIAEHVQLCTQCNFILEHDHRVMVEPERHAALVAAEDQINKLAIYLRARYPMEIERGDHAGLELSEVIIGYLSNGRARKETK